MRVAVVSLVNPYPADNGKKVALSGFLRFLSKEVGADNVKFIKLGVTGDSRIMDIRVTEIPLPAAWRRLWSLFVYALLLRRRSIQEALLFDRVVAAQVREIVKQGEFDVVILDTIRVAQYFDGHMSEGTRWVLYLEDLLSCRYRTLIQALKSGKSLGDPLGTFAPLVPNALRTLLGSRVVQAAVFGWEASAVEKRELVLASQANSICLVNGQEAQLFAHILKCSQVYVTPPSLTVPAEERALSAYGAQKFLILGALDYAPNSSAVLEFLNVCMPIIRRDMPNVRIDIVGRKPPADLKLAVKQWYPQCQILGYLDNLSMELTGSTAMLVPVTVGSGPKLKTLQALSYGLPLITTANGVEAIAVEDKRHCLIGKVEDFPTLMKQVSTPQINQRLAQASRAFFVANYAEEAVYSLYRKAFLGA